MEHPHKQISEIQHALEIAVGRCGSIKAFLDRMHDTNHFYTMRIEWDGISYPTIRKLYLWDDSQSSSFAIDTLYRVHLMVEDFFENERGD
jgi:hypothetical protein